MSRADRFASHCLLQADHKRRGAYRCINTQVASTFVTAYACEDQGRESGTRMQQGDFSATEATGESGQAVLSGPDGGLGACLHAQRGVKSADVITNGLFGYLDLGGQTRVVPALRQAV